MFLFSFFGLDWIRLDQKVSVGMGCFTGTDVEVGGIHAPPCAVDLG